MVSKLSGYKVKGHHKTSSCSTEAGPSEAGPSEAGPSEAGPSHDTGAVFPAITETETVGTVGAGERSELMDSSE